MSIKNEIGFLLKLLHHLCKLEKVCLNCAPPPLIRQRTIQQKQVSKHFIILESLEWHAEQNGEHLTLCRYSKQCKKGNIKPLLKICGPQLHRLQSFSNFKPLEGNNIRKLCSTIISVLYALIGVHFIQIIEQIHIKRLQSILRFPATNYTMFTLFSYTLSFDQYVRVHLCTYIRRDTYPTNMSYTADCVSVAGTQICIKMMFSVDEVLRQQIFERLLLDRLITQLHQTNDACDHFCSFKNSALYL